MVVTPAECLRQRTSHGGSVILARCRYARTTTAAVWGAYAAGVDGGIKSYARVTAGADNGPRRLGKNWFTDTRHQQNGALREWQPLRDQALSKISRGARGSSRLAWMLSGLKFTAFE